MGFQRARSAQQREARRTAILDAARAMLAEMPVAEISLNELSRRVGLAKSNVLRYFESREAVLLHLQGRAWAEWLSALAGELPGAAGAGTPAAERAERVAAVLAASLVARPVLCELISTSAAVLERNVSTEVAAGYKRAALGYLGELAGLVRDRLPELDGRAAVRFAGAVALCAGALWTHARPSAAMRAAYAAEPDLAALRIDFGSALEEMLATLLAGLLARTPR